MRARTIVLPALIAAVMGILSIISIPLPFSPPVTGQTLGVMLAGLLLTPGQAGLAMLVYLLAGAAGAPVFAGGSGGLGVLTGYTGGYLLGFLPAAVVTAWLRGKGQWPRLVIAVVAGLLTYYLPGTLWLSRVTGNGLLASLSLGVLPFIPGDLLKAAAAVFVAAKLKRAGVVEL